MHMLGTVPEGLMSGLLSVTALLGVSPLTNIHAAGGVNKIERQLQAV